MAQISQVDEAGRLVLPKPVRKKLGLDSGGLVRIEVTKGAAVIRPVGRTRSAAEALSGLQLPVGSWSQIEREIAEGAAEG